MTRRAALVICVIASYGFAALVAWACVSIANLR